MEKVELYIIEKENYCELQKEWNQPLEQGDCEMVYYKAMAEAQKQPTEILFLNFQDGIRKRVFVPEDLQNEELIKRNEVIHLIGTFLKEVAKVPPNIYDLFLTYNTIDEVYDLLIQELEKTPWPEYPFQEQMKYERGDEIGKRENVIFLTGEFLRYNLIYEDFLYAPFFKYPVAMSLERFKDHIQVMIYLK
jgi:hypothetical protein